MANVSESTRRGFLVQVGDEEIRIHSIDNDLYGKPRYVVHWLDLGVESGDYGRVPGLTKYRGKWLGGGYVFTAFAVERELGRMLDSVSAYYKRAKELV